MAIIMSPQEQLQLRREILGMVRDLYEKVALLERDLGEKQADKVFQETGNMTQKDFKLIAAVIKEYIDDPDNDDPGQWITAMFVYQLETTYANFSREKFLQAVGMTEGDIVRFE